jgi:8-oxo-dGTP pyrophosphatase MutT (NUDIX family)
MTTVSPDMPIDVVDQNDEPIGVAKRNEVFGLQAGFRVVHVLIFNSLGEILVQQLASRRNRHPGYWGSSVAAYIFSGESYLDAANRRLAEELGLRNVELSYVGKTSMLDEGCRKFIAVFTTIHDGPINFDRSHIERCEFLPLDMIPKLQNVGLRTFTPTFLRVISFLESKI